MIVLLPPPPCNDGLLITAPARSATSTNDDDDDGDSVVDHDGFSVSRTLSHVSISTSTNTTPHPVERSGAHGVQPFPPNGRCMFCSQTSALSTSRTPQPRRLRTHPVTRFFRYTRYTPHTTPVGHSLECRIPCRVRSNAAVCHTILGYSVLLWHGMYYTIYV